jgi:hypothetical protein
MIEWQHTHATKVVTPTWFEQVPRECQLQDFSGAGSDAEQWNFAQGTLPENGNVMPKHAGATIHN